MARRNGGAAAPRDPGRAARVRQFPTVTWRGERRAWALTLGASAVLHALGLALLVRIEPSPPRAGATGWVFTVLAEEAGGGGGPAPIQLALRSLGSEADPDLPAPPASPEIEEPDIPTVDLALEAPVSPEPVPVAPPAPAPPPGGVRREGAPAVGGGTGGGAGAGSGPGTGAGVGPGSGGGGAGDGIRPPAPLTILVPPTATAFGARQGRPRSPPGGQRGEGPLGGRGGLQRRPELRRTAPADRAGLALPPRPGRRQPPGPLPLRGVGHVLSTAPSHRA